MSKSPTRTLWVASIAALAGLFVTACASLEATFQVIAFQEQEHTGIARGQDLALYVVARSESNARLIQSLPMLVRERYNAGDRFREVVDACSLVPPGPKPEAFALAPLIGGLVTKGGNLLFDSIFSEIDSKRDKLQQRSQFQSVPLRATWSTAGFVTWPKVTCIIITRVTDRGKATGPGTYDGKPDGSADEIGLLVVLARIDRGGSASILKPAFVEMNNAVAVTGASDLPSLRLDIAASIRHAAATGVTKDPIAIPIPQITARLRALTPVCKDPAYEGDVDSCPMSSEIFSNPPKDVTALQFSVIVTETGSGVPAKDAVTAGNKALKELTKPVFDEFLSALADAASGAPKAASSATKKK